MPVFETDSCSLHYYEYGSGEQLLLAFHGFGMKGTQFKVLEEAFGRQFRIISFDLFFHGDTLLKDSSVGQVRKGLRAKNISDLITQFLAEMFPDVEKFSILSYSIGTRVALSLIENIPSRIKSAYLIAPDGLEPNQLLNFGGRNFLVNRTFYKLVFSPKAINFLLNLLLKTRYIDDSLHRILKGEFGTTETRLTCYNTVTYFSQLSFDRKKIAKNINDYHLDAHFYFGKKDKLFSHRIGERFARLLNKPNMHVFDEGHELVNLKMNDYLKHQLRDYDL